MEEREECRIAFPNASSRAFSVNAKSSSACLEIETSRTPDLKREETKTVQIDNNLVLTLAPKKTLESLTSLQKISIHKNLAGTSRSKPG